MNDEFSIQRSSFSIPKRPEFPRRRRLPTLWTRSYFVATAGNVSCDTIRRYPSTSSGHRIEMQTRREMA